MSVRVRRLASLICVAILGALSPRSARAESTPTWLEIYRAPGSEDCPDSYRVFRMAAELFPERQIRRSMDPTTAAASAVVRIRPTSIGHEALVKVTRPREGERFIVDSDRECSGLTKALAVALVMLIEPSSPSESTAGSAGAIAGNGAGSVEIPRAPEPRPATSTTSPPTPRKAAPTAAVLPATPPRSVPARRTLELDPMVVGIAGAKLLGTPSAGLGTGVTGLHHSGFGISIEGLRLWAMPTERAPGSVELDLWAIMVGPCYRQGLAPTLTLDSCLDFGGGVQRAAGRGYLATDTKHRPWTVLGPRFDLGLRFHRNLSALVGLSLIGHLSRQQFTVDNDVVVAAPLVGASLRLGLRVDGLGF